MYYESFQRHKKQIIIGIAALLVAIVGGALVSYISHIGKLPVVIAVVPSSSTVNIDGKQSGGGTHWLQPGTYKITVVKDGFESTSKSVVVTSDKSQNVVAVSLKPKSDDAKKWASDHQKDYTNNEQYGAIEANVNGKYFTDKNPITAKLPFNDPYFTIGYTVSDKGALTLTIATPSPRYRFYAVEKIRELGFDPTDFVIDFKDFHNPLEQK